MKDACVRLLRAALILCVFLFTAPAAMAGVSYAYDDLGRVTQATYTDGSIVQYQYDANGNIVAINRLQTSALSIASFTPLIGQANSVVTVTGSGFDTTPANNHVTVGGANAVVNSATPTQLVITVPMNAQTGVIGLTVGANSTASTQQFVVRRPVITSFSPSIVNPGATITVTGNNFALAPPAATVTISGLAATVTSITNTKIVFTAPANTGGPVQVNTSYGQASSASVLTVMPSFIPASEVGAASALSVGGSVVGATNSQPNKRGVISFDAVAGQYLSLQLTSIVSNPAGVVPAFYVFSPSGVQIAAGALSVNQPTAHLPSMPVTGRYLLMFMPGGATFQFNAALDLDGVFSNTAVSTAAVATTANNQTKRFFVTGGAGEHVSIGMTHFTMTGGNAINVAVYKPDGGFMWGRDCFTSGPSSSCGVSMAELPATGMYQVFVKPYGAATFAFDLTVSPAVTGTLQSGTPVTANMSQPAQLAIYPFTVTAGQPVTLSIDSIATNPTGQNIYMSLRGPNGEVTNRNFSNSLVLNYSSLPAGAYRLLLVPNDGMTASARVTLVHGAPPLLLSNGTTSSTFTTSFPGQIGYYDIPATAGQNIGIALQHLTMSPGGTINLSLYQPNGTYIWGRSCYTTDPIASCGLEFTNVPETGNYRLVATPDNAATMSFDLTVSLALDGTLTSGTPVNLDMSIPGRFAYYSFTAAAGQSYALNLGSLTTSPAGSQMWVSINRPDGSSYLAQAINSGAGSNPIFYINNAAAGTWKVFLAPFFGLSGSAQMTLTSAVTGSLVMNDAPTHFSTSAPGQSLKITFQGTAGTTAELASTNLATNPTSVSGVTFSVYAPDGQAVSSFTGYRTSYPGDSTAFNITQTGTYAIYATPNGAATTSFDLNVSQPFTGTLTKGGGPLAVNMSRPAQFGLLDFTATAGQSLTINFSSVTTVPANVHLWIDVVNPSGSIIATAHGTTTTRQVNLSGLAAGTYKIYIWPTQAVTTSMNIEIP